MDISARIRGRREELGWSQEDLAIKMGYTERSTISEIEGGVCDVAYLEIARFASVLDMPVEWLMGETSADVLRQRTERETRQQTFAERLRVALVLAEMRHINLARKTGLNKSSISRYLSGEMEPSGKVLRQLSTALGVDMAWLGCQDAAEGVIQPKQSRKDRLIMRIERRLENMDEETLAALLSIIDKMAGNAPGRRA